MYIVVSKNQAKYEYKRLKKGSSKLSTQQAKSNAMQQTKMVFLQKKSIDMSALTSPE